MMSNYLTCTYCNQRLFDLHVLSGARNAHWATQDQDFGCDSNPDNTEEGVAEHDPNWEKYLAEQESK